MLISNGAALGAVPQEELMTERDEHAGIPELIRGLVQDGRTLLRQELRLARTEVRQALLESSAAIAAGVVAGAIGLVAFLMLSVAAAGALAFFFSLPQWIGYAIVGALLLLAAAGIGGYAVARIRSMRALPETIATIKENLAWR